MCRFRICTTSKQMSLLKIITALSVCIFLVLNIAWAMDPGEEEPTWPGFMMDSNNCVCADGSKCRTSPKHNRQVCPSPECSSHDECTPYDCLPSMHCDKYIYKDVGDHCAGHFDCGLQKLCSHKFECVAIPEELAMFWSSMTKCVLKQSPKEHHVNSRRICETFEHCLPDPGKSPTNGVCLLASKANYSADQKWLEKILQSEKGENSAGGAMVVVKHAKGHKKDAMKTVKKERKVVPLPPHKFDPHQKRLTYY